MNETISKREKTANKFYYVSRLVSLLSVFMMFLPAVNPGRFSALISKNLSVFTAGVSYDSLISGAGRAIRQGWVSQSAYTFIFVGSMLICIGIVVCAGGSCVSLGNLKMKNLSNIISLAGSAFEGAGLIFLLLGYNEMAVCSRPEKVVPAFAAGWFLFLGIAVIQIVMAVLNIIVLPRAAKTDKMEMQTKYRLFLMFLPFAMLAFIFCYLPLFGWRYAFFDYSAGGTLSADNFVGFKWFKYLFNNAATRRDIVRVLRNTLVMSGLGIATSWVPMVFAIFISEIKCTWFRKFVQTFTTIPNFISWVLVYAIAYAIFSTDGFLNGFLTMITGTNHATNYLMGDNGTWFKMLAWGMWKGTGWSAIIYIAAISGIDVQLYEAATVDGAGRFQKMWYITLPGLLPTYCVLLLMAVAGILSNGMDQYLVFETANNSGTIEVLDLYVYKLGISGGLIPLSTVVGMVKTIVSVILLFVANGISKAIRGESIV